LHAQTVHTVNSQGLNFVPAYLQIEVGDTVDFDIAGNHNVVEVSRINWINNDNTPLNGGFTQPFGGGKQAFDQAGFFYYICQPHVGAAMKGAIFVTSGNEEIFEAEMSGRQEPQPVLSTGYGEVTATLDGNLLVVEGDFENLTTPFDPNVAGGSHIHRNYTGRNGPIALLLTAMLDGDNLGGEFVPTMNNFTLTTGQADSLRERLMYVNIHTTGHPGGEIRGQLLPEADEVYHVKLSGANAVPSLISRGYGMLMLEVNGMDLTVTGSFSELEGDFDANIAGGAHLHSGLAGMTGGIEVDLTTDADADLKGGVYRAIDNTTTLTSTQLDMLEDRAMYANIHTTVAPGGEIRGQVTEPSLAVFRADLSGAYEAPPVLTQGRGQVIIELDEDSMITASGSFMGLESDFNAAIAGGAHLHTALAGSNGGIAVDLTTDLGGDNRSGIFDADDNEAQLDAAAFDIMLDRGIYVNIHSMDHPGGELRGQVLPEANFFFNVFLSGTQSATPVATDGLGAVKAEINGNQLTVSGSFANLGSDFDEAIAGGAHLHLSPFGGNGPIAFVLNSDLDGDLRGGEFAADSNSFMLSDGQLDTLIDRGFYLNIHTADEPSGEIRGQLLHEAAAYFVAPLSGTSEVPAVNTGASGGLALELSGSMATVSGLFSGLESDFNTAIAGGAHIHYGPAGRNGPVIVVLDNEVDGDDRGARFLVDSSFAVTQGIVDTMRSRGHYVNIHSIDNASGEIRGQLLPFGMTYYTTSLDGKNEVQPVMSAGQGGVKLELTGDVLTVTGGFTGLESDYNTNIGSHLHIGAAGTNGGVAYALDPVLDGDNRGAIYMPDSNTFIGLTPTELTSLKTGEFYVNVHSVDNAAGEIRGQVLPESNFYPTAGTAILAPGDGDALTIAGDPTTPFEPSWESTTDPDGNAVVYLWQLAIDADFTTMLINEYTGDETTYSSTFGDVAALLDANGVSFGQSITLFHRAVASDGAVCSEGDAFTVTLTRGSLTSNEPVLGALEAKVYPMPASDFVNLEVNGEAQGNLQATLVDFYGRGVKGFDAQLCSGSFEQRLDLSEVSAGIYYLRLTLYGQPFRSLKVVKE